MFEKNGKIWRLVCDECGYERKEDFPNTTEIVNYVKTNKDGWKIKKVDGRMKNLCTKCAKYNKQG
jgi:Fe2+ or Zn2+ uptake regulation protein